MKLNNRHIKRFEQFILNPKTPTEKIEIVPKNRNPLEPDADEDEPVGTPEEEKDLVDEFIEYFERQKLNLK